jgi:chromosome partitioning protein
MGKVYSFALQKGGVGKTTTCVNTAAILAEHGKKVLVIDFDSQGNATLGFGQLPEDYFGYSVLEWIKGERTFEEVVIHTNYGVDVISANAYLSGLTITIMYNIEQYPNFLMLLKEQVDKIKDMYDYIFIDMPPELGFFSINGLNATDEVIIPLQCETRAARGVGMLLDTVENVKENYNEVIDVLGILPTMYMKGTNMSTTILQGARRTFEGTPIRVFDTTIYRTVRFPEADAANEPAVVYTDQEQVQDYRKFVKECFNIG